MGFVDWIALKVLENKGEPIMDKFMQAVDGKKTYITLSLGMIVAVVGHFWGPLHLGPIDVPAVTSADMWQLIWEGLAASFLRHGIGNGVSG